MQMVKRDTFLCNRHSTLDDYGSKIQRSSISRHDGNTPTIDRLSAISFAASGLRLDLLGVGVQHVALGEPVKGTRCSHGVRAHRIKEHPVADIQHGQVSVLGDIVHGITGRSPDGALVVLHLRHSLSVVEEETAGAAKDARTDDGMVEEDAVEGTVHAVVHIVHIGQARRIMRLLRLVHDRAPRSNVHGEGEG